MVEGESSTNEPPGEPPGERWGVLTRLILPAVKEARSCLPITEQFFRSHTFHASPKAFFLWTALDEICKTCLFLMKLDGFLDDASERTAPENADSNERAIESLLLEEERLRARRLCELLVQLVLFAQRDHESLYEHFLLLEELFSACSFNHDLDNFHGVPSEWVQATIEMHAEAVRQIEGGIDRADAWYARYHPPIAAARWQRLLSSAAERLKRAFPLMTDFERLALGSTYGEAFGIPSSTIHFRAGGDPIDHSRSSVVVAEGTKLGVLALCALRRCHELLGHAAAPRLEEIAGVLDSNQEASRLMQLLNWRPVVAIGDFVLARGHLGQVVGECTSSFGHRSIRVEFLAERPLPNLVSDWFRARDVVLLFSEKKQVAQIRAVLGEPAATVENATLRESVVQAWELGLRDQVRRQQL
jgi:hypothetical protein